MPFLSFYRVTACNATHGIALAILSVRPPSICLSVRPTHAWIVTKRNDALGIFWHHMKGQSLCYSDTNSGRLKFALKVTQRSRGRGFEFCSDTAAQQP